MTFQNCSVEMFGDKACIVVSEDSGEIVMLTSDSIQSYHYVKEKKRLVGASYHTYFYYDITFKNDCESYIRMRRKYRDAIERYTYSKRIIYFPNIVALCYLKTVKTA